MQNSYGYNEDVRSAWTPIWIRNSHRSYQEVERRYSRGNFDMASLRPTLGGKPALVLASGPSLEDVKPYLKDWTGAIFCSTSQLPMFSYLGLEPDFCILIDCDPKMVYLVEDYAKSHPATKTLLITHPQVPREYLELWPEDKVYFFRMFDPSDPYSRDYLPYAYGWVNEQTGWNIGSTVLNGGNVVNAMLPMGQSFGYKPLFVCGYDLGYPDNLRRAGDYKRKEDGSWEVVPPPPLTEQRWVEAKRVMSNNGVPFDELGCFYKTSTMILWGMSAPPIISCSRGVMSEWPYVNPREVVEKQGVGFDHLIVDDKTAYRAAIAYLKPRGFMILKTDRYAAVQNLAAMKGTEKLKAAIRWKWMVSRPWKWLGGKGYMTLKERRAARKEKK